MYQVRLPGQEEPPERVPAQDDGASACLSLALQREIGEATVLFNCRARAFPAAAMGLSAEEQASA